MGLQRYAIQSHQVRSYVANSVTALSSADYTRLAYPDLNTCHAMCVPIDGDCGFCENATLSDGTHGFFCVCGPAGEEQCD